MTADLTATASKVLLVDDEENIVRSIARLLRDEEMNLEVLSANSGALALLALEANPDVALILSDQRMPGMSGAEFLQQARELAPDAVRIVLTGYADISSTIDAINKGGASRYLTKPWDDDVLRRTVTEGVMQYRLLQENRALHALVESQNRELAEWNQGLKARVLEQTATIRRQNEELKEKNRQAIRSFKDTIVAFSRLIELHSWSLQEHTRNVTELSVRAAAALGLGAEETETVRIAALLHDIGVIGMPRDIADKKLAALDREELKLFLQHGVRGQTAVDAVAELREAGVLIRHHHERYDGSGFPDRLSGSAIPLGSRIIAFADFVDRELDEQRGESAVHEVLAKAQRALGTALDPALYDPMLRQVRALYLPPRPRQLQPDEKELRPRQLIAGMTLARSIYSGSGTLVLDRGTLLDSGKIETVLRHYNSDPPACGIYVNWRSPVAGAEELPEPVGAAEKELRPRQLLGGMRITRNVYSGTGLLLLTEGTLLDAASIVALSRYYDIDPPSGGVFVASAGSAP